MAQDTYNEVKAKFKYTALAVKLYLDKIASEAEEKQTFTDNFENLILDGDELVKQLQEYHIINTTQGIQQANDIFEEYYDRIDKFFKKMNKAVIEGSGFRRRKLKSKKRKYKKRKRS